MKRRFTATLVTFALAAAFPGAGALAALNANQSPSGEPATCARSPAFAVASAHINAWSHHDFAVARRMLAGNVHVAASTPDGGLPRTDTIGADKYMAGLTAFASHVVPGTARTIAASCDQQHALILLKVKAALGPGTPKALIAARLYEIDANRRIRDEQVIFYVTA